MSLREAGKAFTRVINRFKSRRKKRALLSGILHMPNSIKDDPGKPGSYLYTYFMVLKPGKKEASMSPTGITEIQRSRMFGWSFTITRGSKTCCNKTPSRPGALGTIMSRGRSTSRNRSKTRLPENINVAIPEPRHIQMGYA